MGGYIVTCSACTGEVAVLVVAAVLGAALAVVDLLRTRSR